MMELLALPIGSIIVYAGVESIPPGWRDITGTFECMEQIEHFRRQHPTAGEFIARDPLFCIKRVEAVPQS
jgi:hypothetical protein